MSEVIFIDNIVNCVLGSARRKKKVRVTNEKLNGNTDSINRYIPLI